MIFSKSLPRAAEVCFGKNEWLPLVFQGKMLPMLLARSRHLHRLEALLTRHPIVGLLGARQVGKTTLARQLVARFSGPTTIFDLENPADLARLDDPLLALQGLAGFVVLDEVQRRPELFPVLRVLADRPQNA